jgi:hypothetical protein
MGSADFWADGQWNFFCDLCGRKEKSGNAMKTWNNFRICKHHKEVRNPQDFIRGVKDDQTVPWSRPEAPDTFVVSDFQLLLEAGTGTLLQEPDSFGSSDPLLVT